MRSLWQSCLALRYTSDYFRRDWLFLRKYLLYALVALFACEVMMVIQLTPIQGITNIIVASLSNGLPIDTPNLNRYLIYFAIAYGLGIGLHVLMDNLRNTFVQRVFSVMNSSAMDKLLNLPTSWHIEHATGEKDSKVRENIEQLEYILGSLAYNAVPVLLRILVTAVALMYVGWLLFLFGAIAATGYLIISRLNLKAMKQLARDWHKQREDLSSYSKNLTANWYPLRAFGGEREYIAKHHAEYHQYWLDEKPRHLSWRNRLSSLETFVAAMTVFFYWMIASVVQLQQGITVGALVMAMFWMTRLFSNLYQLNDLFRYYYRGLESLNELLVFFETPSDMPQPEHPTFPDQLAGEIVFDNVSFKYPGKEKYALRNINLRINAGDVLALVGESGGGKSTIASLIAGERPATDGVVLVDGHDIRGMDLFRYRRYGIATVPQQSSLLADTIKVNVLLGKPNATEAEVQKALEDAFIADYVNNLPEKMESKVGEHGVYLSGGQKQRIAIARAFVRDSARILVLDEATSSLDASSQREVQASLERLISRHDNKTVVVIAHRLSTVKIAKRIIVLKDGVIIGEGTHDYLLASCPYYRNLCELELEDGTNKKNEAVATSGAL